MSSTLSAAEAPGDDRAQAARAHRGPGPRGGRRARGRPDRHRQSAARSRRSATAGMQCVDKPQPVGVGPADGAARERQIHADLVGHAGEGPAHAVVREQADAGLGHGEAVALAGDPVRAVERDADAGAHHHPVDQRDGGLGEAVELPVERVFGRQRLDRVRPAAPAPFGHLADVAAGAEGALAWRRRSPRHRSADRAPSAGRRRRWLARMPSSAR